MPKLTYLALLLVLVLHKVLASTIVDRGGHRRNDVDRHQRDVAHRDDDRGTRTVSSPDDTKIPRSVRTASNESTLTNGHEEILEYHNEGIQLIGWHFDYVRHPLIISIFLIVTALCKLAFHRAEFLSSIVPESCMLICLGTIGGMLYHTQQGEHAHFVPFTSTLFFLYLLPPIILDSAFSLHDSVFFDNLGTILLYAVVGTILNWVMIGPSLYGLARLGAMGTFNISLVHCFVFSSLIIAVDPVAVLAIFQEIGVNNVIYFLILGESLLNDAVTIVLYNTMTSFSAMDVISSYQLFLGVVSFFTVSLGGLFIGLVFGVLSAIVTRVTHNVQVMEPITIFVFAYTSYLVAELFHMSGIISIIGCGLTQAQYAFHNISNKSYTAIKVFSKTMSATCDSVIFLFLGLSLVQVERTWHTGFVVSAIALCLLVRFIVVYFLTFVANKVMRLRPINIEEQFIMAYGGLRGAVAFSLVAMLDRETVPHQGLFETTTLAVIIFTVFLQGATIKPLVKLLRIEAENGKIVSIFEEINDHVTDHVMAGVEVILGTRGRNTMREKLDNHFLQQHLLREPQAKDDHIMELYQKIALQVHLELVSGPRAADIYGFDFMDLYKIPEWPTHPLPTITEADSETFMRRMTCRGWKKGASIAEMQHKSSDDTRVGYSCFRPGSLVDSHRVSLSPGHNVQFNVMSESQMPVSKPVSPPTPSVLQIRDLLKKNRAMATTDMCDQKVSHEFANYLLVNLREKQQRHARFQHAMSVDYGVSKNRDGAVTLSTDSVLLDNFQDGAAAKKPRVRRMSNLWKTNSEQAAFSQTHTPLNEAHEDTSTTDDSDSGKDLMKRALRDRKPSSDYSSGTSFKCRMSLM